MFFAIPQLKNLVTIDVDSFDSFGLLIKKSQQLTSKIVSMKFKKMILNCLRKLILFYQGQSESITDCPCVLRIQRHTQHLLANSGINATFLIP